MASRKGPRPRRRIQTLTFIETDPTSGKDKGKQQLARTQGIRNAFRKRYQTLQDNLDNFRPCIHPGGTNPHEVDENGTKQALYLPLPDPSAQPAIAKIDPFETLAVDAGRLAELLHHSSARQAGEPVFSVNDKIDFRLFHNVFDHGLQDPALAHALYLTLRFAFNGGELDGQCVVHRSCAVQDVTARLSSPESAATVNTIGTILLLIGVEGRLGEKHVANVHLQGLRRIVQLCYERKIFLSDPLKRALFWQDLNTCLLTGTRRVFDHHTFTELHWRRDPFTPSAASIPPGFRSCTHMFSAELLEVLADVSSLQHQRQDWLSRKNEKVALLHLDNQQAWIESRLQVLMQTEPHPLGKVCIYAAYMCAYALFTEIWASYRVPDCLSKLLLGYLQALDGEDVWNTHPDLLLWAITISAVSTSVLSVRDGQAELLAVRLPQTLLYPSTADFETIMDDFIWPAEVFLEKSQCFWKTVQERTWLSKAEFYLNELHY